MNLKTISLTLATAFTLLLGACSPKDEAPAASTSTPAQSYATVAKEGKGFTVGAMMSANTVYVMFDPQCPHCGHLWQASVPLQNKVKFVWVPVSFINAKSAPQGAALLMASNPAEAMTAHETSILAGQGGMSASASVPSEIEDAIKKNTALFNNMRVESVPYMLAKNQNSGQVVANAGAMDTPRLATFLGLN